MERETGLESVPAASSSEMERIHDRDSADLAERPESGCMGTNDGCTIAPNATPTGHFADRVMVALLRAQLSWVETGDVRAVRRLLVEALRLLDE